MTLHDPMMSRKVALKINCDTSTKYVWNIHMGMSINSGMDRSAVIRGMDRTAFVRSLIRTLLKASIATHLAWFMTLINSGQIVIGEVKQITCTSVQGFFPASWFNHLNKSEHWQVVLSRAGPQPQAPEQSVTRRTSTTSPGAECYWPQSRALDFLSAGP